MRSRTLILSVCMALLMPLTANAKKPVPEECKIDALNPVSVNMPFTVVVRPGAGQWFNPTVSVEVVVPVIPSQVPLPEKPDAYSQTVTHTYSGLGQPNKADLLFYIPDSLIIDMSRRVEVFATVTEPVNRRKAIESTCETTTSFM